MRNHITHPGEVRFHLADDETVPLDPEGFPYIVDMNVHKEPLDYRDFLYKDPYEQLCVDLLKNALKDLTGPQPYYRQHAYDWLFKDTTNASEMGFAEVCLMLGCSPDLIRYEMQRRVQFSTQVQSWTSSETTESSRSKTSLRAYLVSPVT